MYLKLSFSDPFNVSKYFKDAFNKVCVPNIFVLIKSSESEIDLSTWLSAAKFITALG